MGSDDQRWHRPRSYHHGNLKEVLLEAARKLIEQYGPAGFSLTEAARLAGVSPAAPYRHFRDREALLAELARNGFERFAAKLDIAWNNGIPTPLSAFENLGRAYLAFAREEPASYAVMFEAGLGVSNDDQLKAATDRAFDVLQRAASALCRALPPQQRPPVKLMSLHIWALSHGVADLFVEARPGVAKLPLPPEQILEGRERRRYAVIPRHVELGGEAFETVAGKLSKEGLAVAKVPVWRGWADTGEPCRLGQAEACRAVLLDQLARRLEQDLLQIAVVIGARAVPALIV